MDITKTLKGVIIQDLEGFVAFAKIFDDVVSSKQYERKLFSKTRTNKIKDEILVLDGTLVAHKFINEFHFYVIGPRNECPLILESVLECIIEVITSLLNKTFDKLTFQKKLSQIVLAFDEICENGMILETDSNLVLQRVCLKDDVAEQTITQKLQSATEQFKFPWIRSYS